MKKGRLSKIELSYIENNTKVDVETLATELDRDIKVVQKHLDKYKEIQAASIPTTVVTTPKLPTPVEMMIPKDQRGLPTAQRSILMTGSASEMADDLAKAQAAAEANKPVQAPKGTYFIDPTKAQEDHDRKMGLKKEREKEDKDNNKFYKM